MTLGRGCGRGEGLINYRGFGTLPYRLNWLRERIASRHHRTELGKLVSSPTIFYFGALSHVIGNRTDRLVAIKLKSGYTVYLNSFMAFYIFDEIFIQKVYQFESTPQTILDIGANIGLFSIWASVRWPGVEISAFEPEPDNFHTLVKNVTTNGLSNVRTFQAAVTGDGQPIDLFRHPTNSGGHSTVRQSGDALRVQGCSLPDALATLSTRHCDLLKADCEGGEAAIFRSMTAEDAARVADILYEPEPKLYSVEEMNGVLARLGYRTQGVQHGSDLLLNRDLQGMIWAHRMRETDPTMDRIAP